MVEFRKPTASPACTSRPRRRQNQHIVNHKGAEAHRHPYQPLIDFGGIKSDEDVRIAFDSGPAGDQGHGGNKTGTLPGLAGAVLPERIILGSDVRDGKVAVSGWQEQSELELFAFLEDFTQKVSSVQHLPIFPKTIAWKAQRSACIGHFYRFPALKLIASGGVTSVEVATPAGGGLLWRYYRQGDLRRAHPVAGTGKFL